MKAVKLGRKPRGRNPRVPHLSALLAGIVLPPPPASIDYTIGMPADLGAMLNDSLGDCTCAAWGHAVQVWSFNANPPMATPTDADIESLYEATGGYVPGDPSTDEGCIEQDVLSYLMKTGLAGNKLAAFVEVDPRNLDDVKRTIADCGLAYIGFNVPNYLMNGLTAPGSVWDLDPSGDNGIAGGHAVILAGYDVTGATVISWGSKYRMTWPFFAQFCDEAYALADATWVRVTGDTPGGLTLALLEEQMAALKEQPS